MPRSIKVKWTRNNPIFWRWSINNIELDHAGALIRELKDEIYFDFHLLAVFLSLDLDLKWSVNYVDELINRYH